MSLSVNRFKHHAKVLVGNQVGRFLLRQYSRGEGPAKRLVNGFSNEARKLGVEQKLLVAPVPVNKLVPHFSLAGQIETDYRSRFLTGQDFTSNAGIFSAQNVAVVFPTSMHQVGNHILEEALPAPYLLANPKYYFAFESIRFRRKQPMDEGVLLSMPWHHNFYFWMVEILPRLISYDRCPSLQHIPLIVPKSSPKFVAESLRLAGYLPKTIFLEDGAYRFKKLHMLSMLVQPWERASPDAINWLNAKLHDVHSTFSTPKRIYVSRRDAKIRFVSNELEISDILAEFGFETLVPSDLSLSDQINVFRSAECIIGPHGAAFANLAFSTPRSTFIEFFSSGHYSPAFNRIAGIRDLRYGFLVGEPTALGGFSIDRGQLRSILTQALQPSSLQRT